MIITVVYGKVRDMDAARRDQRCNGTGAERFGPNAGKTCPRCDGSGVRPEGWAYRAADDLGLTVGDVVECPPTPYSNGACVRATVVALRGWPQLGKPLKSVISVVEKVTP